MSDLIGGNPRKISINNNTIQPPFPPPPHRDVTDMFGCVPMATRFRLSKQFCLSRRMQYIGVGGGGSSVHSSAGTLGPNFRWLANFVDSAVYSMEYRCEHNTYQHTAAPNYSLAYNISGSAELRN